MTQLSLARQVALDLERIAQHLAAHEVVDVEARLERILEALELLEQHPLIGRRDAAGHRELVIGRGSHGYVARYRFDALGDSVFVLALRAQRESGFAEDIDRPG